MSAPGEESGSGWGEEWGSGRSEEGAGGRGEEDAGGRGEGALMEGEPARRNVGEIERWASVLGGSALALHGLRRGGLGGAALVLTGGALVHRGVTGRCRVYEALGVATADTRRNPLASIPHHQGIKVERSVTIRRPPEELYRFWRDFENLPRFMGHLASVKLTGPGRTRWVAKGPLGSSVQWEAEIVNDRENELIAWRSLEGADVPNAGSVHFKSVPGGRGTEVKVVLEYKPPAGAIGAALLRLLGEDPERSVRTDLSRFQQLMEAG